jgi:glycosyltransferase involved in cell wall biosynthesis
MALGTPVITSDRGALPEVVGDSGQVVPLDLDAWSHAIDRAISHRADWQSRGRRRAGEFRSVDSGRDLAAVYRAMTTGATRD